MPSSVFAKAIWDRRFSLIFWLIGVTLLVAWIAAFYPALRDSSELQDFIDQFTPEALALFGIDPAVYQTGFGYLQAQLYAFLAPLLLIAFTATAGAAATAGEEERGTLNLLLAVPVTRTRVILEKFAALALQATTIVLMMVLVLVVANQVVDLDLSLQGVVGINLGVLLLGLVFGALAMLVGAWRGRRASAAGVVIGLALITFLVNGFAPLVEGLEGMQKGTPFFWYLDGDPLLHGPTPLYLVLAGAVLLLVAGAVAFFQRADIGARLPLVDLSRRSTARLRPRTTARRGSHTPTSLYGKMIWDRRSSFWWWLVGIGGTAALTIAFWPTINTGGDAMQGLIESIPSELLAMFGVTDAAALLTAEGFLSARLYSSLGTTLMLVFAIAAGTQAVAGEESAGTMDLLMGLPVRRSRVVAERTAGLVTLVTLLMVGLTIIVAVGGSVVDMDLDTAHVAAANVGLGLLALFFGSLALAVGGLTGNGGMAAGVAATVAVAGFLLNGLGSAVEPLEPFRVLSPFYWYLRDSPPLGRGLTASYWFMAGGVVVFAAVTVPGFVRRDIAT